MKKICYVLVLSARLAADVAPKMRRERSLETIFIEKSVSVIRLHAHTHTLSLSLGSHTLPQTPAVTQMWSEEAITRGCINRSGKHAHTYTHTRARAHTLQCGEGMR